MQKNHLLLIGINEYKSISTLTCCKKDCIDLKNILLEKFDFFKNNVIELYDVDATHKGIEDALRSYAKNLNLSDNLIIYYSGHGYYDDDSKKGYWMPYDCRNGNFNTYMKNEYIINMLNKINAKHIFLMTDSCFSRSILLTKGYAEELLLDYNESGIDGEHEFDKEYDEYQSRWALAAGVNEVDDGYEGENSPFADAVINTLKNTNADLRVGTLIEDVKKIFDSNNYQKPQGYPFKDHNHKGGEYIFKIVTDVVDYRDYNEFHNLLTYYNKNVEYLSIAHYSIKKDKIGYRLYKSHDQVTKIPYYYLLIQPGVNQNKTHEHIQVNHPEVFADNNLLVFIAKDRRLVKPERRIAHIKEKFSPLNIFYIEDFIRDNCTPDDLKQKKKYKYLQKANFVLPTYELHLCEGDEKRSIRKKEFDEFFNEWILERDEKILVLLGAAGIGKTTFAQYIADRYLYHYKKSYCIFIKCNDIIEDLNKKVAKKHNIDLYDFYEADYEFGEKDSTSKLSPTLFSMSLDAGNILLIIDGLDEVISKVQNFNIEDFLQSIYDYSKDFKQVKVVLTIRSFFWDDDSSSENMIILDLLPFDSNQMIDFFQKSFYKNNLAIDKAKEIANDFKYTDEENEYVYHPYLLDVVRSMVSVGLNKYPNDPKFKSKILRSEVRNDYIIYKICDREVIRIGQISVDKQIKFFIKMSVEKAGIIKFKDFDAELSKSIKKRLDKKSIKAFKSHPLIDNDKKYFSFKYDFFEDYFKCIYVSEFLRYSSKEACITDKLIHILCESCWFGSGISKDVRNRILEWGEDDILKCSYIVEQIYSSRYEDDMKKMAVSGVFNLALMLNMKFFSNTTTENTKLLKKIFEEKENVISNMQLRNIYDKYDVVKFDFSDTAIQASTIDNYKSFWHCRFNEMTLFQDSLLINNKANIEHDLKITKDQFIDCTTDKDFDNVFEIQKEKDKSYATEIECFIQRYLRLFYNKGRLVGQTVDKPSYGKSAYNCLRISYGKQSNNIMSFKEAMDFFKRQEIIEFYEEYNEQKASIKKIYNEDIVRYIEEGTMSPVIMRIYDELINCK